jgi:NAD(P)-dependent dehydrogenase (short-subunit alcohol dehydrogenase family)
MSYDLSGKISLITGGNRGVGRDTTLRLAEAGSDIILTYRSHKDEGESVVREVESLGRKVSVLQLDVSDIDEFDNFKTQLIRSLQRIWDRNTIDVLVNNAGISSHQMIADSDEETFDRLLNIHFKGVLFLTQKLLPILADAGRIINISSGLARFVLPGYGAYGAMKGAIEVLTRYMAKELGERKITANVVAPGALYTDFNKAAFDANPQIVEFIAANTALGRVGQAEDIGGVIAFLCSDAAAWITGQRIEISGGQNL